MYFNVARKIKKGGNAKNLTGDRIYTDWSFCVKCNKPRKVKAGFA